MFSSDLDLASKAVSSFLPELLVSKVAHNVDFLSFVISRTKVGFPFKSFLSKSFDDYPKTVSNVKNIRVHQRQLCEGWKNFDQMIFYSRYESEN